MIDPDSPSAPSRGLIAQAGVRPCGSLRTNIRPPMSIIRPGVSHTVAELDGHVIACRLCRFYTPSSAGRTLDGHDGICRRYPPVPIAMRPDEDGWIGAQSWWATVDEDAFCGEFLPQPGAEP